MSKCLIMRQINDPQLFAPSHIAVLEFFPSSSHPLELLGCRTQDPGPESRGRLAGSTIGLGTGRGNWRSRSLNLLHFGRDKWHRGTALRFQFPIAWHPGWQTPCPALKMVRPETSHLGLWMCINYQDIISLPGQRSQGEISQWMGHVS